MKLVYHSFMAQKRNIIFWVNLLFILFLSADIMRFQLYQGEDIRAYWILWEWFWIFPMVENNKTGEDIYAYLPLNLQDKKKIYLNYILMMYFILCFVQFLSFLVILCINRNAIYMLYSTNGWLLSVILFLNINMLVTAKCRQDCFSVSKRVTNISIICEVLCIVMLFFPNYKIWEKIGYWFFVGIYFLTAIIFIILIWVSYIDYIPKDSLGCTQQRKKV